MPSFALAVSHENWEPALEALETCRAVDRLAAPADLVINDSAFRAAAAAQQLPVVHTFRSLGEENERYFFESSEAVRNRLIGEWVRVLTSLRCLGVKSTAVDLGLDRIPPSGADDALEIRIKALQHVVSCLDRDMTLAVRVRCPRHTPQSQAWERAALIARDVMDPHCRLHMDVFPEEWTTPETWVQFSRSFYLHASSVSVHWDPSNGSDLDELEVSDLFASLHRRGFRGLRILFPAPLSSGARAISSICGEIDQNFSQPTV